MSTAIAKVVSQDGWELRVGDDAEPRIHDLDLATRLGFARPVDVRKLVRRLYVSGKIKDSDLHATVARTGGRSATEYWLSEAAALRVVAKSETKKADEILGQVIDVYIKVRRGLIVDRDLKPANVVLPTESATTTRTGDVPLVRNTISMLCKLAAKSTGRPLQAIHGYVRKTFRTVGIHQLPIGLWPVCEKTLNALAMGTLLLPPRTRAPLRLLQGGASASPKQQTLPGMEA